MTKRMVALFLVSVFMLCFADAVYAFDDQVTPSGIEYAKLNSEIMNYIEERKEGTASVSISVFERDKTISKIIYGYADIENKVAADENTVYEWGSISKLLVWTSAMQLFERDKLDLNKDIREYLPDDLLTKLEFADKITFLDLMNHRAGFQETVYGIEFDDPGKLTGLEEALRSSEPSQIYKPNTTTAYSNWSTALAAFIIERISGMDYGEYVIENIFKPLNMTKTAVKADLSDNDWVKMQRSKINTYSILRDSYEVFGKNISYINLYPSGSATGTLDDLCIFAKAFAVAEGEISPLFMKRETLDTMLSPSFFYTNTEIARNRYGFWTMEFGKQTLGHGGNTNGFSSMMMLEPESGLGIVIMTNEQAETAYNYGLLSFIFSHRKADENIRADHDISGIYFGKRTVEKGFARISKYIAGILPISKTERKNQLRILNLMRVHRVSENMYMVEDGNGLEYAFQYFEDPNGNAIIESYTADYERANPMDFFFAWSLFIGTIIAAVYAMIRIIISTYHLIKTKSYQKEGSLPMYIVIFFNAAVLIYIWLMKSSYEFHEMRVIAIVVMILIILSLTALRNGIKFVPYLQGKKEKVRQGLLLFMILIPILATLFFQAFDYYS